MPAKWRTISIRQWLWLLMLASALPSLAAGLVVTFDLYKRESLRVESLRIETARALMQAVDLELAAGLAALRTLASAPALQRGDLAAFYEVAKAASTALTDTNLVLSDEHAQQLINTLRPYGSALPKHGDPALLATIVRKGQPAVSDLYIGGVQQQPVVSIDMPVRVGNRVKYVISMGIQPSRLLAILLRQRVALDSIATIIDSRAVVLARTREHERFLGHHATADLVQRLRLRSEDSVPSVTLDGVPVMAAFSRSTESRWTVIIATARAGHEEAQRQDLYLVTGVAVLALVLGLLMAAAVAARIAASVRALVAQVEALGSGHPLGSGGLMLAEADEVARALRAAEAVLSRRTVERDRAERAELAVRAAQAQLAEREAFQRRLFDEGPNAVLLVAPDGHIVDANRAAAAMFGHAERALTGLELEDLLPPAVRERHRAYRAAYFTAPSPRMMGGGLRLQGWRADGQAFPVDVTLSPLGGTDNLVLAAVRDISAAQRDAERLASALREKDILLKELYHRVKNNLQVVTSMIRMQGRASAAPETRASLDEAAARVHAMALVHEKLYQSQDLASIAFDSYLVTLCRGLADSVGAAQRGTRICPETVPVVLGVDMAVPLGLILNELVYNSLKHAFPDGGGTIRVGLRLSEGRVELSVRDDGVGLPPGWSLASSKTLGLTLVTALAAQLDAQFSLHSEGGTVALLSVPGAARAQSGGAP